MAYRASKTAVETPPWVLQLGGCCGLGKNHWGGGDKNGLGSEWVANGAYTFDKLCCEDNLKDWCDTAIHKKYVLGLCPLLAQKS